MKKLILYGVIGATSAFLDMLLFSLLYSRFGINEFISNAVSVHCGIILSFILNSRFNFKQTDKLFKRFLSFYTIGLCGLALSSLILMAGTLFYPVLWVKAFSIIFVAAIQFLLNNFITFRKQAKDEWNHCT